ncbi:hypothetical protein AC578_2846 [Pseudocercospora eumusae]|uniref:Uncharacterized protein n=1 Tax=Pseudocercospora eumusae TaxID=321146 RepID=A0A139H418_9PEZI|nr:hypothetical protein AC578_2846 [Pseudocercospora eumusae]
MDLVKELRRSGGGAFAAPGRDDEDARPPTFEAEGDNPVMVQTEEHSASHEIVTDDPRSQQPEEEEHEEASRQEDLSESNPLMLVSTPRRGQRSVPGFSSPPSFQNDEKAACKEDSDDEGADGHTPFQDSSRFSPVEGAENDDKLNTDDAITRGTEQTADNDILQDAEDIETNSNEEIGQQNETSIEEHQAREPRESEDADNGVDPVISAHEDQLSADDADTEDRGRANDNAALRNHELLEYQASHVDVSSQYPYDDFEQPDETEPAENLARELEKAGWMDSDDSSRISPNGDDPDAEYATTQSPEQADDIATLPDLGLPEGLTNVSSEESHKHIVQLGESALAEHEARNDAITEAIEETNAVAAQDCEQIFNNHKSKIIQIYVWAQFLKWLLRLDTKDIPPGPLEVRICLYGVKILEWLTGVSSAVVADSDWPIDSEDSSFSSSDDNPKPPKPLPPLEGTRAKFFYPLMYNYELYQRRLIYYHIWLHRKNHNFPHAKTRTSPAEMYGSIRDASYIFFITAVVSIVSLVALVLGCWMVSRMVKNAAWSLPSSLQLATDSQTPGVHAQIENIRPTGIANGTTSWSAFSQALDFAVTAASMNFSAAYTPHILIARQRASRSMFESQILYLWASRIPSHLAVFEAAVGGDNLMDDIYSRIELARNVVGPFQRGLLGLDSLVVAGEHDWIDSGHVAAGLYGAREAQNVILGGMVETTHGM